MWSRSAASGSGTMRTDIARGLVDERIKMVEAQAAKLPVLNCSAGSAQPTPPAAQKFQIKAAARPHSGQNSR